MPLRMPQRQYERQYEKKQAEQRRGKAFEIVTTILN
jgi:spore cortex formation protein SpoVR/YcgB (stage V sporulation)